MQNLHLLRRYIREAIDMGETQFSPNRSDTHDALGNLLNKKEANTPDEEKLYNSLVRRIVQSEPISQETGQTIIDLLDSKYGQAPGGSGFFSEPPPDTILYRGQNMTEDWLRNHVSPDDLKRLEDDQSSYIEKKKKMIYDIASNKLVKLIKPYQFKQLRGWSLNIKQAVSFAVGYASGGDMMSTREGTDIAVVLKTTPSESGTRFLDFSTSMYRTDIGIMYADEKECVNLGPVTVNEVVIAIL